jgi:lysophospholipase L1-like esterase
MVVILVTLLLAGCTMREQAMQRSHRIVFFGDSITELGARPGGYVTLVRDSLASLGVACDVYGAGISGNKINDLLARAERDVLSKHPTVVVIYIGINDVWHHEFTARGLSGTPKPQFDSGLRQLTATLRNAGAQVILCTPTVIGEQKNMANKYDAMLEEYSSITRSVASETGSAVCDLRTAFTEYIAANNPGNSPKDILTYDGVHLNDAGNRFLAGQMLKVLDGSGLFFPTK